MSTARVIGDDGLTRVYSSSQLNWPSREEWATQQRTLYDVPCPGFAVSYYATDDEAARLVSELRERWKALGRQMRSAPECTRYGCEHSGCKDVLRDYRRSINRGIKALNGGDLPVLLDEHCGAQDIMRPFLERYKARCNQLYEQARQKAASRPIDDEAWQRELERRARIERYFAEPCVHEVGS